MSDIRFFCPACQAKLAVDHSVAGYAVDCPECGKNIQIPKASDTALLKQAENGIRGADLTSEEMDFLMGAPPADRADDDAR